LALAWRSRDSRRGPARRSGNSEVLHDEGLECPPQPAARELRPWLGRAGGVLAPHVSAAGAAVATHRDLKDGGSPPQRLVRESTDDRVPSSALGAAASAPLIRGQDPAGEDRSRGLGALTGHDEVELIEAAERGQVRAGERARALADGSVRQVEVSRIQRVGTFIRGSTSPGTPPPTRSWPRARGS